jgi:hypothetical protein
MLKLLDAAGTSTLTSTCPSKLLLDVKSVAGAPFDEN